MTDVAAEPTVEEIEQALAALAENGGRLTYTIELDGTEYVFRLAEVSALAELELWQSTGLTVEDVLGMPASGWQPHVIALFVFLARRSAGERVDVVGVLSSVTYGSQYRLVDVSL